MVHTSHIDDRFKKAKSDLYFSLAGAVLIGSDEACPT